MTNKKILGLLAMAFAVLSAVPGGAQEAAVEAAVELTPPYSYRFTSADRVYAAQACVHEATWAGAELTGDCGGILQVAMERRHRGESFADALARTMPRFAAGITSRAWTLRLPPGPLRVNPEGWPYDYPARHHDDAWLAVNLRVGRYMRGAEPLPCSPTPRRWFGRVTDGDALARTLAEGRWCEARCGESRNAFLARCGAGAPGHSTE
jgi:hypothetical protein